MSDFPTRIIEPPAFVSFARRVIVAAGRRCAEADPYALAELIRLRADLDTAIHYAADGLRAEGYSWADLARPLGITRSAAQQQFGRKGKAS